MKTVCKVISLLIILSALAITPLFGNKPVIVVSGSMEPAIVTGALTVVHSCKVADVKQGDVVMYYSPDYDEYITHRCVEKGEDYCITRGDANHVNDPTPVIDDMLYGKVILTANWLAPLFNQFLHDREFDRIALVGLIFNWGVALVLVVMILSSALTYLSALYEILTNKTDDAESKQHIKHANTAIGLVRDDGTLSLWQRVRLYIAHCNYANAAKDVSELLEHYHK